MGLNKFLGIGNLGGDPQLRETSSGTPVCNFNIAIDRRRVARDGDDNTTILKETDWIPVVVWGRQAESCHRYLQKGSKVAVEGRLAPRTYTDAQGTTHYTFEVAAEKVEFLDKIRSGEEVAAMQTETPDGLPE